MSDKPTFVARAARWTRYAILAGIASVLALIVTTPRNEYPLTMSRAQANIIAASPGYLMTSLSVAGANNHFYLVDTTKQVICVYNVNGDKLRLVAARKFDADSDIQDGSTAQKGILIEGGNGITRDQAKTYWEELKPKIEELAKKKKPR